MGKLRVNGTCHPGSGIARGISDDVYRHVFAVFGQRGTVWPSARGGHTQTLPAIFCYGTAHLLSSMPDAKQPQFSLVG
jgi:hypothetical protein